VDADTPRFIARGLGYVHSASVAADPLEAIREEEQAEQTRRAHRRWAKERQRRWGEAAQTIRVVVADFAEGGVDRKTASDLRAIERDVRRVSRRLDDEWRRAEGA
jgi:hypothetical protein